MITHELSVLGIQGDTKVTWDKDDPVSRAKAREEIKRLKEAGFMLFLVDGSPADELVAGNGELLARIASEEEIIAPEAEIKIGPTIRADYCEDRDAVLNKPEAPEPESPKKRGRKAGIPNKPVQAVAVRPMRGGSDDASS
jgi:hypothetical protein